MVGIFQLQKMTINSGQKVNEHDFLGRSCGKFPGETELLKG